jgi:hypothetical protein
VNAFTGPKNLKLLCPKQYLEFIPPTSLKGTQTTDINDNSENIMWPIIC